MAAIEFSESSFGYALVDNIMHGGFNVSATAPIFPSLRAEGSAGGGYDVKIPARPVPLFLQFKIPKVSSKAVEDLERPCFRMPIRTSPINQHKMLIQLEKKGNEVLYATPKFLKQDEFDCYYESRRIVDNTAFFRPSNIGELDSKSHHVAYDSHHLHAWVQSEPQMHEFSHDIHTLIARIANVCNSALQQNSEQFINRVLENMVEIIARNGIRRIVSEKEYFRKYNLPHNGGDLLSISCEVEEGEHSLDRIAYLSRRYFGCEFFVIGKA